MKNPKTCRFPVQTANSSTYAVPRRLIYFSFPSPSLSLSFSHREPKKSTKRGSIVPTGSLDSAFFPRTRGRRRRDRRRRRRHRLGLLAVVYEHQHQQQQPLRGTSGAATATELCTRCKYPRIVRCRRRAPSIFQLP